MTGWETSSDSARSEAVDLMLVADDGRITALVGRLDGPVRLRQVPDALDAICRLAVDPCPVVLINLAGLEQDAARAVRACRRVGPSCRILLYGEAHHEGYARQALAAGADDYLIWPIPGRELFDSLRLASGRSGLAADPAADPQANPTSDPTTSRITTGRRDSTADPAETTGPRDPLDGNPHILPSYLRRFRGLAELIPRGKEVLIERAQGELADLLGVEWLEIRIDEPPAENAPAGRNAGGVILPLCGPAGTLGTMHLGPSRAASATANGAATNGAVETAGEFLATLLHLARRDESLKHLATVDELTGAYNRRYLEYFLRQVIETTDNRDTEVTLLIFDLDEFKYYNDTYGHLAGDEVLRQTTRLMRRCCRSHDIVARLGGDEFAVLFWDTGRPRQSYHERDTRESPFESALPDADRIPPVIPPANREPKKHPQVAMFLSNRFRRTMKTSSFGSLGPDARGCLSISGGLACYPYDGQTAEELFAQADVALLSAKRSGKNRIYLVGQPHAEE